MKRWFLWVNVCFVIIIITAIIARSIIQHERVISMERIYVNGKNFIDKNGRVRIFHGVNLVCKDKSKGYVEGWDESDFEELSRLGFNLVRLGIIWDGIEPEPGIYDEAYLDRIEELLDLCAKHGIYVILDMHQDLYSVRYSDGAPEWATITDSLPEPGEVSIWSDAYLSNQAIQRAFDHFWANDAASDGIGLQDHLAGCWKRIAQRFGERPEVLGYDFLNEPFPGSDALSIFGALLSSFSNIESSVTGKPPRSLEEISDAFFDDKARFEALQLLDDRQLYKSFVSAAESLVLKFDATVLSRFYERMAKAVRSVTPEGILFMENNYFGNLGVPSGIQPIEINGKREKLQGFAPHGYDLVVDTPLVGSGASENRAGVIFDNHYATQQRLDVPVIVGEWGAFGAYKDVDRHCLFLLDTFDRYGWSFTYWAWRRKESGNFEATKLIARDYPKAIAGDLVSFSYDHVTGSFFMEWKADALIDAPTVICLPGGLKERQVEISPSCAYDVENIYGTPHLVIKNTKSGRHTVTIKYK